MSTESFDPLTLIPELCRLFYTLGWVTGTGGGITMKKGDKVYIAPSGVQKERIQSGKVKREMRLAEVKVLLKT